MKEEKEKVKKKLIKKNLTVIRKYEKHKKRKKFLMKILII